jgi:hypothetical protein
MITLEHRHYKLLASFIAELPDECTREQVAAHIAKALRGTNPRYSQDRFEAAARGTPSNGRDKVR